ncbi:hypothetical protein E2C01_029957 [Portunus trituberculatus]|uniref:Uncharacterized protein n=1 Tax=Portunus trituberculatus TaxID=210409 RepID=A0A5B7ETE9_PORTR|nr:hypothetical protein [Portunus trituberculatus]
MNFLPQVQDNKNIGSAEQYQDLPDIAFMHLHVIPNNVPLPPLHRSMIIVRIRISSLHPDIRMTRQRECLEVKLGVESVPGAKVKWKAGVRKYTGERSAGLRGARSEEPE